MASVPFGLRSTTGEVGSLLRFAATGGTIDNVIFDGGSVASGVVGLSTTLGGFTGRELCNPVDGVPTGAGGAIGACGITGIAGIVGVGVDVLGDAIELGACGSAGIGAFAGLEEIAVGDVGSGKDGFGGVFTIVEFCVGGGADGGLLSVSELVRGKSKTLGAGGVGGVPTGVEIDCEL